MSFRAVAVLDFKINLMFELLTSAQRHIKPDIPSARLRRTLQIRIQQRGTKGDLFLTQFWAIIVHDGRRGFGPKDAKFLVFFVDPADDPRGPTPNRAADQRKLTAAEFQAALDRNKALEQINPSGGPMQHMIIVKDASGAPGRVSGVPARPFFLDLGAQRFESLVDDIVIREMDKFVSSQIIVERLTARGTLGSFPRP